MTKLGVQNLCLHCPLQVQLPLLPLLPSHSAPFQPQQPHPHRDPQPPTVFCSTPSSPSLPLGFYPSKNLHSLLQSPQLPSVPSCTRTPSTYKDLQIATVHLILLKSPSKYPIVCWTNQLWPNNSPALQLRATKDSGNIIDLI